MADHISFAPIDEKARDGSGYLVRTTDGLNHAASFVDGTWCYSGDRSNPVPGEVTEYCTRNSNHQPRGQDHE